MLALTDHDAIAGVPGRRGGRAGRDRARAGGRDVVRARVRRRPPRLRLLGRPRGDRARPASAPSTSGSRRAGEIVENLRREGFDLHSRGRRSRGRRRALGRAAPHRPRGRRGREHGAVLRGVPGAGREGVRPAPLADRGQAVELIHDAGGAAVVAHPYWDVKDPAQVEELIRALEVDGIEAFYPVTHAGADRAPARALRGARADPDRLLGLPRPDPQDLLALRRLQDLRPRRAAGARRGPRRRARRAHRRRPPRSARFGLDVGAAVAGADQGQYGDQAEDRDPGAGQEGRLEALGERRRRPRRRRRGRRCGSWRSSARTASPSAPPTCCEVLIRPLARPASRSLTPATAAIVCGTKANPRPTAASSDGPRMSVEEAAADRDLGEPEQPGGDRGPCPATSTGLKPIRVTSCEAMPGGDDDRQRQRQVGEPGVDRAVAEHLLHVEGDEEEHREQRGAGQHADDVGAGQRPQPEDAEGHQRRGRAQLDRDEGGEQRRGEAASRPIVWVEPQPASVASTSA